MKNGDNAMRRIKNKIVRDTYNSVVKIYVGISDWSEITEDCVIRLSSGIGDTITQRQIGNHLVVLSQNGNIPYFGLEVFDMETLEKIEVMDLFFQESQVYEEFSNYDQLSPITILGRTYDKYSEFLTY